MAGLCLMMLVILPGVQSLAVTPKLNPVEDSKYRKDLGKDDSPGTSKYYTFDHPYPAVQDTGDFDKDYVKDENADGGKWAVQMQYDVLRNKMRSKALVIAEFKKDMEKHQKYVDDAKAEAKKAADARIAADKAVAEVEKQISENSKEVDALEGATGAGGAVGKAVDNLNDEKMDLEECKKKLAAARKELADALAKKQAIKDKLEAEAKAKKDNLDKAAAADAEADASAKTKQALVEDLTRRIKAQTIVYKKAKTEYASEYEEIEATEESLKKAEDNLRSYRHKSVDQDGGVYYKEQAKSSARRVAAPAVLLFTALATALSQMA